MTMTVAKLIGETAGLHSSMMIFTVRNYNFSLTIFSKKQALLLARKVGIKIITQFTVQTKQNIWLLLFPQSATHKKYRHKIYSCHQDILID
jgi:hypothetical protein